jgi:hypothetical protein
MGMGREEKGVGKGGEWAREGSGQGRGREWAKETGGVLSIVR